MKKVTVSILLIGIMSVTACVFALDLGTEIPLAFSGGETKSLWKTDWSPDGKLITFTRKMYDGDYHENVWIVSTVDGATINLTGDIEDRCITPRFSPDGNEVMFTRWHTVDENLNPLSSLESIDIYSGDNSIVLEEGYAGAWSCDGRYITYVAWPGGPHCNAVYDTETQDIQLFDTPHDYYPFDFFDSSMSPDNTHL